MTTASRWAWTEHPFFAGAPIVTLSFPALLGPAPAKGIQPQDGDDDDTELHRADE